MFSYHLKNVQPNNTKNSDDKNSSEIVLGCKSSIGGTKIMHTTSLVLKK